MKSSLAYFATNDTIVTKSPSTETWMMKATKIAPRPKRGNPAETRKRLIAAAAECFNSVGFVGVDARRIAKEAGYSSGVFYKHFKDKREVLVAAYRHWVESEWQSIAREIHSDRGAKVTASRIVDFGVTLHSRWFGLRTAMMSLQAIDANAREAYRDLQRHQLKFVSKLRKESEYSGPNDRISDAILLTTLERVYDALASGEFEELGLDRELVRERAKQLLEDALTK